MTSHQNCQLARFPRVPIPDSEAALLVLFSVSVVCASGLVPVPILPFCKDCKLKLLQIVKMSTRDRRVDPAESLALELNATGRLTTPPTLPIAVRARLATSPSSSPSPSSAYSSRSSSSPPASPLLQGHLQSPSSPPTQQPALAQEAATMSSSDSDTVVQMPANGRLQLQRRKVVRIRPRVNIAGQVGDCVASEDDVFCSRVRNILRLFFNFGILLIFGCWHISK